MPTRRPTNVFLLYMPPRNLEAMLHYRETIETPVPLARIAPHIPPRARERLKSIFGDRPIAVWGSRDGRGNRSQFEKMAEGDEILIVEGRSIKLLGKVAMKVVSPERQHRADTRHPGCRLAAQGSKGAAPDQDHRLVGA